MPSWQPDGDTNGVYSAAVATGTISAGLAAQSEIYQFRWTDSTRLAAIMGVRISAGSIVAFTPGICAFDLCVARLWTVAGTGGNTLDLSGNNQKLKLGFASSIVNQIRIASTGALGVGTKTLDAQCLSIIGRSITSAAGDSIVDPPGILYDTTNTFGHPLILGENEGFVIRATVPATGTWRAAITILWSEMQLY